MNTATAIARANARANATDALDAVKRARQALWESDDGTAPRMGSRLRQAAEDAWMAGATRAQILREAGRFAERIADHLDRNASTYTDGARFIRKVPV